MIKPKGFTKVGVVGYGVYLPAQVIAVEEIARVWQANADQIQGSLGVTAKTVASADEDSITMATTAAQTALQMARIVPNELGAVFVGSESHPYAVKPSGTVVGAALGLNDDYFCADLQFACKAATAGLQLVAGMIEAGMIKYGLVIGADKAQAKPGDVLEYTAASAAVAVILGPVRRGVAQLKTTVSVSSDTPDFWRRPGREFPEHLGRFTGEPAYFLHVQTATEKLLAQTKQKISDIDHVVFHMPNAKFPQKAAQRLGVSDQQLAVGFTVPQVGNPYSASALLGLVRVLEQAQAHQSILMTSYGSGSGSDSFLFTTTGKIKSVKPVATFADWEKNRQTIDYPTYLRQVGVL